QTTINDAGTLTRLVPGPVTTEEKDQKKNDVKARSMLLMALEDCSQMAILGENISQEDLNLKFLRSLPFEWNTHVNMAFVSSPSSTNEVNTAYGVNTADTQANPASTQVNTASTQNQDSSRRTVNIEYTSSNAMVAIDGAGFDWSFIKDDEVPKNMALMAFSDSKLDLSNSRLEEFKQPEFKSYRPKSCEKESKNVSEDIPNELKEYHDAYLVKDRVSDNKDCSVESPVVVEKKTVVPTIDKVEFVRPKQQEKPNRVLVVKPHNKTPYELFRCRTLALSFMRPFGCHVTILNTLDNLGKFDGKSDNGFFVGYSLNSKAFRVYNTRTKKVEENLHVRFLEDKPIIAGDGPKWLFDIDVLTKLMNYLLVVAGTDSNDFVDGSIFNSSSKIASNDEPQPFSDARHKDDEGSGVLTRRMTKTTNDQGFISAIYEGKTHADLHTCLFACFLSQDEPKKVILDRSYERRASAI
nr:ribonuclease H-like domain-containing protein [Tanacetum cinerariifolium]